MSLPLTNDLPHAYVARQCKRIAQGLLELLTSSVICIMQGTDISCECIGAAAFIGSLSDLPAALEGLIAHVADSGATTH